ncbi:hypothetical protein, partial [Escherichia coli]|uniref:hypothetical protein n=1 Tax=Escherichia coli TaxID=562 RepID=UPI001BD350E8
QQFEALRRAAQPLTQRESGEPAWGCHVFTSLSASTRTVRTKRLAVAYSEKTVQARLALRAVRVAQACGGDRPGPFEAQRGAGTQALGQIAIGA